MIHYVKHYITSRDRRQDFGLAGFRSKAEACYQPQVLRDL